MLFYLRDWAVLPLGVLWLAGLFVVLWAHRGPFGETYRRVRDRLAHTPVPPPPPAAER